MGCENCTFELKYKDRFQELIDDQKTMKDKQNNYDVKDERRDTTFDFFRETLMDIKTKVDILVAKPAIRWEKLVATVTGAIIAGIIGYFIAKGG